MQRYKPIISPFFYLCLAALLIGVLYLASTEAQSHTPKHKLILKATEYQDSNFPTTAAQLKHRIEVQPFNLPAFIIFALAITHTLMAHYFHRLSEKLRERNRRQNKEVIDTFGVEMLQFMGEVEVIFGLWVIPLVAMMSYYYSWSTAIHYLNKLGYAEPIFVVVIMAIASTRPILEVTESCLKMIARIGGESVQAWWLTILTIGPLAGSFITEPGAMTLSALLLGHHFYRYKPSATLAYATIGLLFVNISVGGVLTSFAAPPVLMVSTAWSWDTPFMAVTFGWKAALGILTSNLLYYAIFRKELAALDAKKLQHAEINTAEEPKAIEIPLWITFINIVFLAWMVVHNHYPIIVVGSFLLFLGFQRTTHPYQKMVNLSSPILVGFFLAGLVVHGNLQGWWISPVLGHACEECLILLATGLTSLTDNAEITFLSSLIPTFDDAAKYAVMAGAVTGGGLTVIANAPNPLGQAILGKYFHKSVSTGGLFLAALPPTLIVGAYFWFFRPN